MRVTFTEYKHVYKGRYPEPDGDFPIIERKPVALISGKVVSTVVMHGSDAIGNLVETPYFVVALDDGSFKSVSINECTIDKDDMYLDD